MMATIAPKQYTVAIQASPLKATRPNEHCSQTAMESARKIQAIAGIPARSRVGTQAAASKKTPMPIHSSL
jgi:hypothetical protein